MRSSPQLARNGCEMKNANVSTCATRILANGERYCVQRLHSVFHPRQLGPEWPGAGPSSRGRFGVLVFAPPKLRNSGNTQAHSGAGS
jgi:hypothetical protein